MDKKSYIKMSRSRKVFLRYIEKREDVSKIAWNRDNTRGVFRVGKYKGIIRFVPYENIIDMKIETGVFCNKPFIVQLSHYLNLARMALKNVFSTFQIDRTNMVCTSYNMSFNSSSVTEDDYARAFYYLLEPIELFYSDIVKIACGYPIFDRFFVESRLETKRAEAIEDELKNFIILNHKDL